MCRIGSVKSRTPVGPSAALTLMLPQQEGHDNSGFAMVMHDMEGPFGAFKDKPILSAACTEESVARIDGYMRDHDFTLLYNWTPRLEKHPSMDIRDMPRYLFRVYDYPPAFRQGGMEDRGELLLDTRLTLRAMLEQDRSGFVYSFWPDTLTLKEIGDPRDIADLFHLWDSDCPLLARDIVVQCRQNTNYDIVRYAAHPFFLQGYTLCANGENTFYTKNMEFQKSLHRGYIGFESDSQCLLYTLHYVLHEMKWPVDYYKHVITPLPFAEMESREDRDVLSLIRQTFAHLEINGPNTVIAMLPDGRMITCCDSKKLRPVVVGRTEEMAAISSEVCGLNALMPDRRQEEDVYPGERELVVIGNDLHVCRHRQ